MHRLFWKIFLSFWAALVLFAFAAIIAASGFVERLRDQHDAVHPRARIMAQAAQAQAAVDRGGLAALRSWLQGVDRRQLVPLFLLDEHGADLLGRSTV